MTSPASQRRLAAWIVGTHLVLGMVVLALNYVRSPGPTSVLLAAVVGITFAQAGLLGTWLALSSRQLVTRLIVVTVGVHLLGVVFAVGVRVLEWWLAYGLMFVCTCGIVSLPLWVSRALGAELRREEDVERRPEASQFSIRQLLLLTLLVASLLTLGRLLGKPIGIVDFPSLVILAGCLHAIIPSAAAWLLLTRMHLAVGAVVLVLLTSGAALVLSWSPISLDGLSYDAVAASMEALTVALTLGVVRWHGYRLRRLPAEA